MIEGLSLIEGLRKRKTQKWTKSFKFQNSGPIRKGVWQWARMGGMEREFGLLIIKNAQNVYFKQRIQFTFLNLIKNCLHHLSYCLLDPNTQTSRVSHLMTRHCLELQGIGSWERLEILLWFHSYSSMPC